MGISPDFAPGNFVSEPEEPASGNAPTGLLAWFVQNPDRLKMSVQGLLQLSVPWWELVIRAVLVYGVLLFLLRLTGKRQVGDLAPFDLVLLLILSNAVQNGMNAGDDSALGGLILAVTLVGLNHVVGYLTYSRW